MLKSEMCYNIKKDLKMEPLGLQKLMQMHLNNFGETRVAFVYEEDAIQDFDEIFGKVIQSVDGGELEGV